MRTYTRINEDYLDNSTIDTEDISMHDEICSEIDRWIHRGTQPSFDVQRLPDGFYSVSDKNELSKIIESCMSLYGNECSLNWIDVSKMKEMSCLFVDSSFNGDISRWNVSNVTDMRAMFKGSYFNSDISRWNVSRVQYMQLMFNGCPFFNSDITGWNTSSVREMHYMFSDANNFNQDLS